MNDDWQAVLGAWNLAQAGRWEEAAAQSETVPGLADVIAHRSGRKTAAQAPVIVGWQSYQRAEYLNAWKQFGLQEGSGWLRAWAELGLAKVASDCGRWRIALHWCARAWRSAESGEHLDLLAEVAGARGEILLRAGCPAEAAASFAEDIGLLPPGNCYRGRVRCYQAHAWSRMGPKGQQAAKLAYRLAAHSVGEAPTKSYALAGLALLGSRLGERILLHEVTHSQAPGIAGFWIKVAQARLAETAEEGRRLQGEARDLLPSIYHAEHWWLNGWVHGGATRSTLPTALGAGLKDTFVAPDIQQWTGVELPVDPRKISDAPWLDFDSWPTSIEGWWTIRDVFMP